MIKKSFLLGAIVSIITTNAIANQVLTSQTYVDNQDALKVNIAQGVGTNNANVGKTLVVNSSGNLELGTVSADNFVEDSITDGVTDKAPSENAVNDALAEKQDIIPAGSFGENNSVVTYGANAGDVEERFILDYGSDQTHEANIKNYMANGSVTLSSDFVMQTVLNKTEEQLKNSLVPAKYIEYGLNAKQYKITPGTTGSVAIFDGADSRGGSKFTERAIYDGSTTYDSTTDANKLITAGAVDGMVGDVYDYVDDEISNIPAPELPTGNPGYAVLYDENGDVGDEMIILDENFNLLSGESPYDLDGDGYGLLTQRVLGSSTDLTIDLSGSGKIYPTVSGVKGYAQPSIPAGTQGSVVIYDGTVDSGLLRGKTKFTEKAIANAPIITNGTLTNGNDIASINAVQTKQNKMTCTRWIDNAAHTDANCLLWNMAN